MSALINGLVSRIAQIELDDLGSNQKLQYDGCCDYRSYAQEHHGAEGSGKKGAIGAEYINGRLGQPEEGYVSQDEVKHQNS